MKRIHTLLAMAAMSQFMAAGTYNQNPNYKINPSADMGPSPFFSPTRSQIVKRKKLERQKRS